MQEVFFLSKVGLSGNSRVYSDNTNSAFKKFYKSYDYVSTKKIIQQIFVFFFQEFAITNFQN